MDKIYEKIVFMTLDIRQQKIVVHETWKIK